MGAVACMRWLKKICDAACALKHAWHHRLCSATLLPPQPAQPPQPVQLARMVTAVHAAEQSRRQLARMVTVVHAAEQSQRQPPQPPMTCASENAGAPRPIARSARAPHAGQRSAIQMLRHCQIVRPSDRLMREAVMSWIRRRLGPVAEPPAWNIVARQR